MCASECSGLQQVNAGSLPVVSLGRCAGLCESKLLQFLARLEVDLDKDSDKRRFASKSFVDKLIDDARRHAGARNPCQMLSEQEHTMAIAGTSV